MPIFWDDIDILRALDRLEGEDRAYYGNGEDLLKAAAGDQTITEQDRAPFVRQLLMLQTQGRLTFEQQSFGNARLPQPHEREFPQSLWHFQLTDAGRDRARARIVYEAFPDPDEDDGRTIPGLVLERVAGLVAPTTPRSSCRGSSMTSAFRRNSSRSRSIAIEPSTSTPCWRCRLRAEPNSGECSGSSWPDC